MPDPILDISVLETAVNVDVAEMSLAIEMQEAVLEVSTMEAVIEVEAAGPRGPQGEPGPGAVIEVRSSYGDATPVPITTVVAGKRVYAVALHVTIPFDGAGAVLRVGDPADLARLMDAAGNDPGAAATYEANPNYQYAIQTPVVLSISPGAGPTQGEVITQVYLEQ